MIAVKFLSCLMYCTFQNKFEMKSSSLKAFSAAGHMG